MVNLREIPFPLERKILIMRGLKIFFLFVFLPLCGSLQTLFSSAGVMTTRAQALVEASLLQKTGQFLYHRYLGNSEGLNSLISDTIEGYQHVKKELFLELCKTVDFDFPVASVQANARRGVVKIVYDDQYSTILEEDFFFQEDKLTKVYTVIDPSHHSFRKRIMQCGGADSERSIRALKSVRMCKIATEFLALDLKRDIVQQCEYLSSETVAFGEIGKENIMKRQFEGVQSGLHYTAPFPLQFNLDADSVSMDFYAHRADQTSQRGTDILYLDIYDNKILKIDTIRHTLQQPEWVRRHFQN